MTVHVGFVLYLMQGAELFDLKRNNDSLFQHLSAQSTSHPRLLALLLGFDVPEPLHALVLVLVVKFEPWFHYVNGSLLFGTSSGLFLLQGAHRHLL